MGSRLTLSVGMEKLHNVRSPFVFTAALLFSLPADLVHSRGTLCATAQLTKWVFGVCLDGPAKRAGPRRENGSFSGLEDTSPMEGGTTD